MKYKGFFSGHLEQLSCCDRIGMFRSVALQCTVEMKVRTLACSTRVAAPASFDLDRKNQKNI